MRYLLLLLMPLLLPGQSKSVLVITSTPGDYLMAAGGTLASLIEQGYTVNVVQVGNDEKRSLGLSPADTRLANNREGEEAARMLGIREVFLLNHKSGELSQAGVNELRNQIFGMVRHYKPQIIFHPDPWIHYEPNHDHFFTARPAEEFSYGGGRYVGEEFTKMGLAPVGVRETYYYSPYRPYRPGEGGHNAAKFRPVDITKHFNLKAAALQKLETANRVYASQVKQRLEAAGKPSRLLAELNRGSIAELVRAYVEELAETIGQKHGFRYGEEFNWHGGGGGIPEHIREKAKEIR
ncbi:MAG: PIG-L family deacetylase [Bryobacterales bacterium]|nr:PIG-L family deacetylase [Bryobacterales bacterium]